MIVFELVKLSHELIGWTATVTTGWTDHPQPL